MSVQPVVDWRPDFAFTHVMHLALETLGSVPRFRSWPGSDEALRDRHRAAINRFRAHWDSVAARPGATC